MNKTGRLFLIPVLLTILTAGRGLAQSPQTDFSILNRWVEWSSPETLLIRHLNQENFRLLDEREAVVAHTISRDDWIRRRDRVRQTLVRIVGPFPERTPLNPQVTGVVNKTGFRVEKLVYESMPDFYVTAALFVPEGVKEPRPGILNVIGHSGGAFRRDIYQNFILNLVNKGFVVLTIDPLGQGERLQYVDPSSGESSVGSSTREHSYCGNQCFLSGYSVARYFIWDGIRGIDYLTSRPEVDPERIGVTGLSGGGTQTAMIAAMDVRVKAAAPTCYITGYRRLLASIGPQDGEQNLYHALANGIDHAEFLLARAPKPTLVVATTRDFFSIQGVRETALELGRAYRAFGVPEVFSHVEDDGEHGFTRKNNEATYAFFQQHLQLPGDPAEKDIPLLTEEELKVTSTGQVSTSLNSRTVFDLNQAQAETLLARLESARRDRAARHLKESLQSAKQLSGYRIPRRRGEAVFRGRFQRDGYSIEKYALSGEGTTVLPTVVLIPENDAPHRTIIYLQPEGKHIDAEPGGPLEQLVQSGFLVVAPDLLGYGETAVRLESSHAHVAAFYNAQLAGRSLVGLNAGDVIRVLAFCKTHPDVRQDQIAVLGLSDLGPAALLSTALEPSIRAVILVASPLSYSTVVMNRFYEIKPSAFVAGALTGFDLQDLMANVAPRSLALVAPTDEMNRRASADLLDSELWFARETYARAGFSERFRLVGPEDSLVNTVAWALP